MSTINPRLMGKTSTGFTIVELLIVVVVIAILAAITIVAFSGIQNQAHDSAIEADLNNASKKLELYKVENGRYPASVLEMPTGVSLSKGSYDPTMNNAYYCNDKVNNTYALGFRSKSMKGYIKTISGLSEGVSVSGAATCSAISKTWVNDATTAVIQGYGSTDSWWNGSWSWTQ